MNVLRIMSRVSLASAEEAKRACCGGRCGTIHLSLEEFAKMVGNPHEALPKEQWRDYSHDHFCDGKITAIWRFATPRGPVEVSDYWWNAKSELSIRSADGRAMRWFIRWCGLKGMRAESGGRTTDRVLARAFA